MSLISKTVEFSSFYQISSMGQQWQETGRLAQSHCMNQPALRSTWMDICLSQTDQIIALSDQGRVAFDASWHAQEVTDRQPINSVTLSLSASIPSVTCMSQMLATLAFRNSYSPEMHAVSDSRFHSALRVSRSSSQGCMTPCE